ncbi:MAG: Na(+)/H(+) antiporter subunit B [Janthinobacterium lividum]
MTKITKNISIFMVPYIILYSLYIQLNGEASPGGGFQAGVIFASSLIAYDLVYGSQKLNRYFSVNTLIIIATLGVMIYGFTGVISLFFNDNYLNYYSLTNLVNDSLTAQHIGIFAVEIGIGLTVSAIMYLIYNSFNNCE